MNIIQYLLTISDVWYRSYVSLIIVRFLILPLGLYQSWKASYQSEKMAYLKPIFEPINERMRNASTQEEKLAAQTELMVSSKRKWCESIW